MCAGCGEVKDVQFDQCLCDIRKSRSDYKNDIVVTAEHEELITDAINESPFQVIPRNDLWNVLRHAPRESISESQSRGSTIPLSQAVNQSPPAANNVPREGSHPIDYFFPTIPTHE